MLDEEHEGLEQDENEQSLLARAHWRPQCCHCLFASRLDRQQSRRSGSNADEVDYQIGAVWTNGRYRRWCSKYTGGHPARDVVVSQGYGGVIQYDFGKASPSGFHRTGFINSPPSILLSVVSKMRANHLRRKSKLSEHVSKLRGLPEFTRDIVGPDVLFEATYHHAGGPTCQSCSSDKEVDRQPRESEEAVVHYGTIASGNQVMRDGSTRDRVSAEFGCVLCFEMEAAGLMNSFPCLVIGGICDYADSHKNKRWQAYVAGTAAAYAKEVLSVIPTAKVAGVTYYR